MGIFRNKNTDQTSSIDSLYPADPTGSAVTTNATDTYDGPTGVNIVNSEDGLILKGGVSENRVKYTSPEITDATLLLDIAQSHHFTVHIEGFNKSTNYKIASSPLTNKVGFLPVKAISLKYTSYENMSIPVAIFGDFPLLNRKRVSTIDLTCYDTDDNKLEYELRQWESMCFPKGRFVAYMEDIARKLTYRGYNVKGEENLIYEVYVIPSGNVSVSRDYSANEAKILNFSVVVVGDGRTCATGDGKVPSIFMVDGSGAGDGTENSGPYAYKSVSARFGTEKEIL